MEKPKKLEQIDWRQLIDLCQEYLDFVDNDDEYYEGSYHDNRIFESAMMAIYGEKIWDFINNRRD